MLTGLHERQPVMQRVALVVAHPDDETIAAGGSLHLLPRLLLVHVTDGAPRGLADFAREGFASPVEYARARAAELDAALAISGAHPVRETLAVPDQAATLSIPAITARLRALFQARRIDAVLTHAYEGGHPDHDATALAVHLAAMDGPEVFEFAGYHSAPDGALRTGVFLPGPAETVVALPPMDRDRKTAMLGCFRTQADILAHFSRDTERFRRAPNYDFTAPPHVGRLNYENWGWMSGSEWRRLADAAMKTKCAA